MREEKGSLFRLPFILVMMTLDYGPDFYDLIPISPKRERETEIEGKIKPNQNGIGKLEWKKRKWRNEKERKK